MPQEGHKQMFGTINLLNNSQNFSSFSTQGHKFFNLYKESNPDYAIIVDSILSSHPAINKSGLLMLHTHKKTELPAVALGEQFPYFALPKDGKQATFTARVCISILQDDDFVGRDPGLCHRCLTSSKHISLAMRINNYCHQY